MKKLLIAIISLIAGILIGGFGGLTVGGGTMAGIGIATGLSSGICITVKAATDLGLLTDEQVDQVLNKAAENAAGHTEIPEDQKIVGTVDQCNEVIAKLKAAQ
jgi:hypothetical protein